MRMTPYLFLALFFAACNPAKKAERTYGTDFFQHWVHSHEDDGPDYRAFRPSDFSFPPARGREGFEIKKDGSFVHHQIGPADAPVVVEGKWTMKDKSTLKVTLSAPDSPSFELHIAEVQKDMLKLKN